MTRSARTALTAAAARAAHLIVDGEPYVFADTLAAPLLGDLAEELLAYRSDFWRPTRIPTRTPAN
jgi:hypothetical protein